MNLKDSQTKENLMRAFAGESQARNRYTIAAAQAKTQQLHVLEAVFTFTANQEREHAEVFYKHLAELNGQTVEIDGTYPVEVTNNTLELLQGAHHNETEEADDVYPAFAATAKQEGFAKIAQDFLNIAKIEKTHAQRFEKFATWMQQNKLFVSDVQTGWMCLNCGYVLDAAEAPKQCPVCSHDQGFFIRIQLAPFTE